MFIAANDIAKNPNILEVLKISLELPAKPAIIAPTIITDEIALVTDIKGVCSDGVIGITKNSVTSIRNKSYWNYNNLNPKDPVALNLFTQKDLVEALEKAERRIKREKREKEKAKKTKEVSINE